MDYETYKDKTNELNFFMRHNNIFVTCAREDYAELEMEVTENSLNAYRVLHGGAYFTMADCAAGVTARSRGVRYVTLSSSMNFLKAVRSGKIKAIGRVVHRGSSTCIVHSEIFDEEGVLVADGTFTMFNLEGKK